jgi:hypothetical protein
MCYPEASLNICVGLYEACNMGKNKKNKVYRRSEKMPAAGFFFLSGCKFYTSLTHFIIPVVNFFRW